MREDEVGRTSLTQAPSADAGSPPAPSKTLTLPEHEQFTVVFNGDLRAWPTNPFHVDTPFGRPVAIGLGNAFDELEAWADDGALAPYTPASATQRRPNDPS